MNLKNWTALVLVFGLVLSLAACTPAPEPTTEPTTVPTTLPPTAEELYADAVAQLEAAPNVELTVTIEQTVDVAGTLFTTTTEQTLTYSGAGTDELLASGWETMDFDGQHSTECKETWLDGQAYLTVDGTYNFSGTMTGEEFLSRYVPVVMLDAANYGHISKLGSTLRFSDGLAGESWLVPEYAELLDASGSATLDEQNAMTGSTYHVVYAVAGTTTTYDISTTIRTDPEAVPSYRETSAEYVQVESLDAIRVLNQASGYLHDGRGRSVTTSLAESMVCYAAGVVRNQSTQINYWGTGKDYMGDVDVSLFFMELQETYSFEQTEHFANGVYTYSTDGSEPEEMEGVSASIFQAYCLQSLTSGSLDLSYLSEATAEDLGSLYYLEFTGNEEAGLAMDHYICEVLWGEGTYLDDLAEDYRTDKITFYFAIDKFTGLPTAMGCEYEGAHTLDGMEYPLTLQTDRSFDLVSDSAYETLAEHTPEVAEPEEKATPLFYHVTGPDGQEMWLLGTIHVGDVRTSYLPQEIYDAFDSADALAVEYNSEAFETALDEDEDLSDQVSGCYFYDDGTTTQDHIEDAELYEYALKLLKATGSYHMNAPYLKAYLWSSSIDNYYLGQGHGLSSTQGVDNQLLQRARDQEKTVLEVESGLFQIQMLTGFSDPLQEELLLGTAATEPLDYIQSTQELFELWCAGDEAALTEYLNSDSDTSEMTEEELALVLEYETAMSTDRNAGMLEVAKGYLESGDVVFYAVGLAHLLAEDGLVNTLRDAGYTVELVPYT